MHKSGLPQLTHAGIDNGVTRLARLPCHEALGVICPREKTEFRVKGLVGHGRKMKQQVVAKLSPANLAQRIYRSIRKYLLVRVSPLERRATPAGARCCRSGGRATVWTCWARRGCLDHPVILYVIIQKARELLLGTRLARLPQVVPSVGPVGRRGRELPVGNIL